MAAVPNGRSATRIKRKPPPAFPYSARYPLPDPSDPFAPLQVLRERAHSSHSHALLNHSNSSLAPSPPSTGESERFGSRLPADVTPPPRAFVHASRSTEAFEQFRDGYHSENTRPPRPPRARTRPARDSKSYFSDADLASTQSHSHLHHNQDHHRSEKLTERQYHYRRRSQTLSFFPHALPQVPPPADEPDRPATQEDSRVESSHHPNQTFHSSQNQYVYDDRQSHGHVYGQAHAPHPSSTVDSHCHSHLQLSVHSGPVTPPMTPDDTLTDRSDSVLSDIPPPPPKHITVESDAEHGALDTGGRVERELSRIRTSDFPTLLGKSEPDSPPPLPVPPPRPHQPLVESEPEPEPEQEHISRRRSGFGSRDRKDSITHRLRRSSFLARVRKVSDPSPPTRSRRLPAVRDSMFGPSSHTSGQADTSEDNTATARNSTVPEVLRASGASAESTENKRSKMSHRKSLSHVSLGVTPLPNVSFGPSASPAFLTENVSMASTLVAYPDGDEFGGPAPSYPAHSQPEPEVQQPQPRPVSHLAPQTLAQALDLTPLPPKDSPLPPIRKDARLPTPPREGSSRSSRVPTSASSAEYGQRRETQLAPTRVSSIEEHAPEATAHTTFARPLTPINAGRASEMEMEMDEVVLMRSSHFEASLAYEQEHPSPSPPLLAHSLLSRPTSAATVMSIPPPPVPAPLVSPAPVAPHINVPAFSVSHPPVRPDIGPRRVSTPPPPPPPRQRGPSPPAPRREPSPLPPPPRDEFGPPNPAPLPLSPPRRMDADFPTPLPQPPLPPPSQPLALRAKSPVHLEDRPRAFSPEPAPEPSRPRTPHESRPRRSDEPLHASVGLVKDKGQHNPCSTRSCLSAHNRPQLSNTHLPAHSLPKSSRSCALSPPFQRLHALSLLSP
ncbi:hypothetical protein K466DRAFT_563498 [Polyporus arcularius HHB13444]|uniref:Uncharacterized protein n=1 Tax=Polyporus arcularius HHB13444 TaxID=1314778 RepID=A0A5C3PNG6_9APHY|nr:hypothetical protein K466DRAFT_563498 [Polyporus arcularius HHB13444]